MNYLAHIYLSGANRQVRIGNFIGDAVKGNAYQHYPGDWQQGILLHRRIDAFTDAHPLVRAAVEEGRAVFGRYAAVVTDIFFDHFLAKEFPCYAGMSLNRYAWSFYAVLLWHYRQLPPRFQGFLWHFIATNRLARYATFEGIQQSLAIMAEYRGLQVDPAEAVAYLQLHFESLHASFCSFFPAVQQMCRQFLGNGFPGTEGD